MFTIFCPKYRSVLNFSRPIFHISPILLHHTLWYTNLTRIILFTKSRIKIYAKQKRQFSLKYWCKSPNIVGKRGNCLEFVFHSCSPKVSGILNLSFDLSKIQRLIASGGCLQPPIAKFFFEKYWRFLCIWSFSHVTKILFWITFEENLKVLAASGSCHVTSSREG